MTALNPVLPMSKAFTEAAKIRFIKYHDYGGLSGYFPFGAKSYCHEINKKAMRLVNLISSDTIPSHESIEDNLIDLINYASYYYEYLQERAMDVDRIQKEGDDEKTPNVL